MGKQRPNKSRKIDLADGRRLSVEQALYEAMAVHQSGRVRLAAEIYRSIVEVVPQHADALHLLGLTERHLGNVISAVELIQHAIAINPRIAMFHSNLGEAYRTIGRVEESEASCRQAIDLEPGLPEAHLNLGASLLQQHKFDAALSAYAQALVCRPGFIDALLGQGDVLLRLDNPIQALLSYQCIIDMQPDNAAALTRIGITLRKLGRIADAIEHYEKAIKRCPKIPELHNNLALLYQQTGHIEAAVNSLRTMLTLTPDDDVARHILDSIEGTTTARAPAGYVREIFDGYAETFEAHLVEKLGYHIPSLLAQAVKHYWGEGVKDKVVLDIGCGTGLFGVAVGDAFAHLVGIDIAPKMIEKAGEKGIYTELHTGDILDFLKQAKTASYDLVAATDVFIYIGSLDEIFSEVRRLLQPGGLFGFSVESMADAEGNFKLDTTGRYRQSATYLNELAVRNGLVSGYFREVVVRHQQDQPVPGYLCIFTVE